MIKSKILLPVIAGGALLIILAVSVIIYKMDETNWHPYVMFFPQFTDPDQINGEIRKIRRQDDDAENIERFAEELILGPADLRYLRIFPRETKINTVMLRDNKLYIDFSHALLFAEETNPLTLNEGLDLFSRSIRRNFPDVGPIIYTVNGEVPFDFMTDPADK